MLFGLSVGDGCEVCRVKDPGRSSYIGSLLLSEMRREMEGEEESSRKCCILMCVFCLESE